MKSRCKRYRTNPDGSETYLGEFEYEFLAEIAPNHRTRVFTQTERMLAAANAKRRCEELAFEDLVDRAQRLSEI